ncbi:MAG: TetR/AcrR family transcriptional regulator [Bacillota bacterium]
MSKTDTALLRDRKKKACRDKIYKAAIKLFLQKGYDQTTVEEIAEAANVSRATFFNYFSRKEELVLYYTEEILGAIEAAWKKILLKKSMKSVDKLLVMTGIAAELSARRREAVRLMLWRRLRMYEGEELPYGSYLGILSVLNQVVTEGQEKGEFRSDIAPISVAENFLAIYGYYLAKLSAVKNTENLDNQLMVAIKLLLEGIIKK